MLTGGLRHREFDYQFFQTRKNSENIGENSQNFDKLENYRPGH